LTPGGEDLPRMLRRFGEKFLAFVCTPEATGTYRMVVAQSGQSDIGRSFFELGPKRGEETVTAFIQSEMDGGRLKKKDALVAAMHLTALLMAETQHRMLMNAAPPPTRQQLKQMVDRAVAVFMDAYGL
jgi:hypothetical protein